MPQKARKHTKEQVMELARLIYDVYMEVDARAKLKVGQNHAKQPKKE